MKQINHSDTRTFRRIAAFCTATVCMLFAGTGSQAQTPKEATYDVSLGNPGAGGTTSSTVLSPKKGNLAPDETASNIEDLFMGAGEAGVFVRPTDGTPGSAFSMIIRGVKNFRGTAEPLYICSTPPPRMPPKRSRMTRATISWIRTPWHRSTLTTSRRSRCSRMRQPRPSTDLRAPTVLSSSPPKWGPTARRISITIRI